MRRNHIDVISLGCSKNLVDSERLIRRLQAKGYTVCHDPEKPCGEFVVVNTCGFIGDAKEESVNMILALAERRKRGEIGSLAVMGCLSERYREELKELIPEIDLLYGKFDWNAFIADLPARKTETEPKPWERSLTGNPWSTYLKISEGCNRFCAFCAIPLITGRHTSRPEDEILEEVRSLVAEGVREFNVIAQDLSSYGMDIYGRHALPELIDRMAEVPGVEWIRLHYAYPSDFPYEIIDVIRRHPNVCGYMDIALQHVSDHMLTRMRRHSSKEQTLDIVRRLKEAGIKVRTTLLVGFPGETEEDFRELCDFVREARFDRMGAFAYSEEEGTYAALNYADDVPEDVKQRRLDEIMAIQREVAEDLNAAMVGRTVRVLIDRLEGTYAVGRTEWDSPEVDQEVYVSAPEGQLPKPGEFAFARITSHTDYDLYGELVQA